jgi:hypothetical protein
MESLGVVFLGVIAFASAAQVVCIVALARSGQRVARRVDEIQRQLDRDIRPTIESLNRFSRNLGEISDRAALQARRVDRLTADLLDRIEAVADSLRRAAARPFGPVSGLMAFIKGLRRGIDVYHQLRGSDNDRRAAARRYAEDDEHLFI